MESNIQVPNKSTTPSCTVYGWLAISFSFIPLSDGFGSGKKVALIVGAAMLAVGIVLVFVGRSLAHRQQGPK